MTNPAFFTIFLHIHRTGGTTLDRLLYHNFRINLFKRQANRFRMSKLSTYDMLRKLCIKDKLFSGHLCYGIHDFFSFPFKYISLVRDPISRLLSLYKFCQLNSSAYYHKFVLNKTFEQFVLDTELHELDNAQTRIIAGHSKDYFINRTPFGQCGQDLLDLAKHNIDKNFLMIGTTELFDESFLVLCQLYGWEPSTYFRNNETSSEKDFVLLNSLLETKIREKNSLDYQLHSYVTERLKKQLINLGITENLVAEFKNRNLLFSENFKRYNIYLKKAKSFIRENILRY